MTLQPFIFIAAITCAALMAGLFFSWSFAVMPGLSQLGDAEYLRAFQAMNRTIQNPVFFAVFFGTLLLLPANAFLQYRMATDLRFWLLAAAAAVYVAGGFLLTVAGNVPINESLDAMDLSSATPEMLSRKRYEFEVNWARLNMIRTCACTLCVILMTIAAIVPQKAYTDSLSS